MSAKKITNTTPAAIVKSPDAVAENTTARAPRKVADALKVDTRVNRDKTTPYDNVVGVSLIDFTPSLFTRTDVTRTYAVKVTPSNVHSRVLAAFMSADTSLSGEKKHRIADYFSDEHGAYIVTRYGGDAAALDRVRALLWAATIDDGVHLFRVKSDAVVAKCAKRVDDILIARRTAMDGAVSLAEYETEKAAAVRRLNAEYFAQADDDVDA